MFLAHADLFDSVLGAAAAAWVERSEHVSVPVATLDVSNVSTSSASNNSSNVSTNNASTNSVSNKSSNVSTNNVSTAYSTLAVSQKLNSLTLNASIDIVVGVEWIGVVERVNNKCLVALAHGSTIGR